MLTTSSFLPGWSAVSKSDGLPFWWLTADDPWIMANGTEEAAMHVTRDALAVEKPIWIVGDSAYDTLEWHDPCDQQAVVPSLRTIRETRINRLITLYSVLQREAHDTLIVINRPIPSSGRPAPSGLIREQRARRRCQPSPRDTTLADRSSGEYSRATVG